MKANDPAVASECKAIHGFFRQVVVRGQTLLPRKSKDGQNRPSDLGIWGMLEGSNLTLTLPGTSAFKTVL